MRYDLYIDYNNTGVFEKIIADSIDSFQFEKETQNDGSISKLFYRILWGKIQLRNVKKKNQMTYDIINSLSYSDKVVVKHVTPLKTIFGYFGKNDCEFDHDRKILTVTPAVIDRYTSLLENWENEVDFTNFNSFDDSVDMSVKNTYLSVIQDWPYYASPRDTEKTPVNKIKVSDYNNNGGLNLYFENGAPKQSLYADSYYGFAGSNLILTTGFYGNFNLQDRINILGQTPTSEEGSSGYYKTLPANYGDFELCKFKVYEGSRTGGLSGKRWINLYCQTWFAREEIVKIDVEDADSEWGFEKPEGDGWHMRLPLKKNGKDAHTWTRKPFNGAYESSWKLSNIVENSSNISNTWYWSKYLESYIDYPTSTSTGNLKTSIKFRNFFEYLFNNSATELVGMNLKSTFFLNDDEDTFMSLVGASGNNYVTGNKNYLNNCRFIFTKDIQPKDSDKKNKVIKLSIKKLFDELNKLFCNTLGFFIDDSGALRIEHTSIIDLYKNSIDISNLDEIKFTSKWSFDKQFMFEKFEFNMVNSAYPDFCNNTTSFDKMVSNNRNKDSKLSLETTLISSDIKYCILNPSELSDGLILCAFDSKNILINSKCILSGEVEPNGVLSLSNILYDFATYEGIWIQGKINNLYSNFRNTKRTKLGIEITLKGFYESMFFNTQFGIGMLDSGSIDFVNEITKVKLRYRYDSGINNDLFRLMFQKAGDLDDSIDVITDICNYDVELNSFFNPEPLLLF